MTKKLKELTQNAAIREKLPVIPRNPTSSYNRPAYVNAVLGLQESSEENLSHYVHGNQSQKDNTQRTGYPRANHTQPKKGIKCLICNDKNHWTSACEKTRQFRDGKIGYPPNLCKIHCGERF